VIIVKVKQQLLRDSGVSEGHVLIRNLTGLGAAFASISAALTAASSSPAMAAKANGGYQLEFRSRDSDVAGHSFVIARRTASNGKVISERTAGFRPANAKASVAATISGVKGTVGTYREDFTKKPTLTYRVNVSQGQYRRAIATIDDVARKPPTFRALSQNCNTFVGDVARAARLQAPGSGVADRPESYVGAIRQLNSGHSRSEP
jgi:hypothetical protein